MKKQGSKIVVIGAGNVGATTAYTLLNHQVCSELVIIDMDKEKAIGQAIDMAHAATFYQKRCEVKAGDYSDCSTADVIIISASAPMDKNARNRIEMLSPTKKVMKSIMTSIVASGFTGYLIVISNPVDIMTYYAWELSGLDKSHIIGSGTVLDSARLRYVLCEEFHVNASSIHAMILGEHGDSEFTLASTATIGGKPLLEWLADEKLNPSHITVDDLTEKTKKAGWEIFSRRGATSYGIATSACDIAEAILFDEKRVLPVSSVLQGEFGLSDVALSLPCVIGKDGVESVLQMKILPEEQKKLNYSGENLKSYCDALKD